MRKYLLHCCIIINIDANECTENQADCINEAVCVNIVGNYTCNCPGGYTGDGRLHGSGCVGEKLIIATGTLKQYMIILCKTLGACVAY